MATRLLWAGPRDRWGRIGSGACILAAIGAGALEALLPHSLVLLAAALLLAWIPVDAIAATVEMLDRDLPESISDPAADGVPCRVPLGDRILVSAMTGGVAWVGLVVLGLCAAASPWAFGLACLSALAACLAWASLVTARCLSWTGGERSQRLVARSRPASRRDWFNAVGSLLLIPLASLAASLLVSYGFLLVFRGSGFPSASPAWPLLLRFFMGAGWLAGLELALAYHVLCLVPLLPGSALFLSPGTQVGLSLPGSASGSEGPDRLPSE